MEKYYEYSDDKTKCKHLFDWIEWCRRCIFEALCLYEHNKNNQNKEEEL